MSLHDIGIPTYEQVRDGVLKLIDEGKISREDAALVLPELRESEDERIRKHIIKILDGLAPWDGNEKAKCIAYLERMKYDRMKPIYDVRESFESALKKAWNDYHNGYENVDKLEDDYVECAHAKGFREGYLFGIGKREEQKPENDRYMEGYMRGIGEQKPAEWSEEDEKMLTFLDSILEYAYDNNPRGFSTSCIDAKNWLKSLRPCGSSEKPNNQAEWSEEDENYYDTIVRKLQVIGDDSGLTMNQIDFLEKHRPQPHWKPSEEQMDVLKEAVVYFGNSWLSHKQEVLESLYNDLKKLM